MVLSFELSAILLHDLQDFSGFRTIVLVPRFRPHWPAPGLFDKEHSKKPHRLGAPRNPWPVLLCDGKPVCAATVRVSLGYLEVSCERTACGSLNMCKPLLQAVQTTNVPAVLNFCTGCSTQVPFFATLESKRKKGYGRALVEAIEEVSRSCTVSAPWCFSAANQCAVV